MYRSLIAVVAATTAVASVASADVSGYWGWDDGGSTILGSYGNLGYAANVLDPMGGGSNVLEIHEDPIGGTPQAYVAWITGLTDGDTVYGSFMGLGSNNNGFSSTRIWGHYTETDGTIDDYGGSAGGNGSYSGDDWTLLDYLWTFDSDSGDRSGLVIEARIYTGSGDSGSAYIDDLFVDVVDADGSGGIEIHFAAVIPAPGAIALLGLAGLVTRRRRK